MDKLTIQAENAKQIYGWLQDRGGIHVWNSIDLSDLDRQMISPANDPEGRPTTKPHWKMSEFPKLITDPEQVIVSIDKEVKRFHVATRMGSQGLSVKVTDGGSRRIRREVAKAGEGAYYTFDYGDYKNAVIMAPEKTMPIREYIKQKGE